MILNSYAKLNLYLAVISKRKDNYHNIESLFERIKLRDKIVLSLRDDKLITISCTSQEVPQDSSNLGFKAAEFLQKKYKITKGVDIHIDKHIPIGSGMGGGSSNAAAVLMGLNKLWGIKLSRNKLAAHAAKIGSDVPFFVYNSSFAHVKGRGERVKPLNELKNKKFWHILIVPRVKISTALIYRKWDRVKNKLKEGLTHSTASKPYKYTKLLSVNPEQVNEVSASKGLTTQKNNAKILVSALKAGDHSLISKNLFNSLEQVTFLEYPEVSSVKEKLVRLGQKAVLMSGSGSTVFSLVSSRKEGMKLFKQLKNNRLTQVFLTTTR